MELDTPFIHLCTSNGILVGTYKTNQRIGLEAAREIVRARKTFTGNKRIPALIISRGLVSIDRPARKYFSSAEGTAGLIASAIVVDSVFTRCLSNFFLSVHQVSLPVKIFSNRAKAAQWLQQFVKEG